VRFDEEEDEEEEEEEEEAKRSTALYLPTHPTPTRHRQLHSSCCTRRGGSNWNALVVVDGRGLKELQLSPRWLRLSGTTPTLARIRRCIANLLSFHESVDTNLRGGMTRFVKRPNRTDGAATRLVWSPSSFFAHVIRSPMTPDPKSSPD
jgi:hypothetical protein